MYKDFRIAEDHINVNEYVLVGAHSTITNHSISPVARIPVTVLDDYFGRVFTGVEANQLVKENLIILGRIINSKHQRNESAAHPPYVILNLSDLESFGEKLTAETLAVVVN